MATGGGGGRRGVCWKTCYFPVLFWAVSAGGWEILIRVRVPLLRLPREREGRLLSLLRQHAS